ncbi:MAG: tetratricopeptide repeat protein, partial [Thermodesulfobacteriota bacterium]
MAFKFCPECGTAAEPGARFCAGCGKPIGAARASALPVAGIVALASLLLLGAGFWLYFRLAPAPARPLKPGEGQVAAAPADGGQATATTASGQPHPQIELPDDIKQYIANLEKDAKSKPQDVAAWQTLARVQYRASRLDPSYAPAARAAFEHLLELDKNNLDGLRGLGNIAYDQQDRKTAIDYYERYLALKPDDPEVRTDLGTMLFESGDVGRSEVEFKRVIEKNPQFFQAYFNLGIVYEANGDRAAAKTQLEKARDLAPDDAVKTRIGALITAAEQGIPFTQAAEAFAAQQAQAQA